MKSSAYWQRRFEELEAALLQKGERYNADEVERQFHLTMAEIEKEIARWYQRLGDNNEISAADARKLLSRDELKEFHWTVEEYIKRGRESNYTDKWKKQLENASAKVHITRFEAMKLQLQQQLEVLYGNQVDGLDKLMKDIYTEGFRRSAFTIDTGMGVHYDLSAVNPQRIDTIVKNPWVADGKNFSDRLWRDKEKLAFNLQQEMQNAVARGDKFDRAVKNIAQRMNVAKSSAARLVMTESAFISGKAQRDCFAELGVEEYEFVATLDRKTSETCRAHDGKVYKVKDYKPGTNAPPMHCWCRSCIVPYFGDDEGISGERAARDPDTGKRVMVPADMTYPEWEKKFAEQVRVTVPDPAMTQNYAPVKLNNEQAVKIHRGDREITLHRVLTAANPIYVSESVTLKPKALHNIDGAITQVLDILKVQRDDMPKVYVVSHADMQKPALASYLALDNVIFLDVALGNKRKALSMQSSYAASDNYLSTLLHEYYHWLEARKYIDSGKPIRNNEDYAKYIAEMNRKAKKAIERLEKQGYNVGRVSEYAQSSLEDKDYDEAYTEFKVYEDLR